ncbi:MAG TPA: ThuA domain-containing protein [Tepidisphaeraceae bacterium]|jgi:trehalose utilization protein
MAIRVTVWNEFRHEKKNDTVKKVYPNGIHEAIASHLRKSKDLEVRTATQDQEENGLTEDVLKNTDVLTWWGHMAHSEITDLCVERVYSAVMRGMGLIVLHSGHFSRPFIKLMGTSCNLKWREHPEEREILWVTRPGHPILEGIDDHFILDHEEMYGEFFDIPEPDETILVSSFTGGEVFRSGCTFLRGAGKIFYFRPGHETFPTYHNANVLKVIENACRWAKSTPPPTPHSFGNRPMGWIEKKS